jgi:hypothetical protein
MRGLFILLILLFGSSTFAQQQFLLTGASEFFDIRVAVSNLENGAYRGKASFSFYKKGGDLPYQVIDLPDTYVELDENAQPSVNATLLYDKQSVVNIGDYNFDGMEDVALCNGTNGSYGMPSYSVYLSSRNARKFVYDKDFSALGCHLGMFELDKSKKVLRTFDKSGCCWHVTEEFTVVDNVLQKVLSIEEDATIDDETKVKVTIKTFVNGKWETEVKFVPRPQK